MPKLSILAALKHMQQLIANNWLVAARFCLPWLILMAVLNAWQLLSDPNANTSPENFKLDRKMLLLLAVNLVATSSIAVSWHRHILMDEPQSKVMPFRLDRIVGTYLIRNLMILAITIVPLSAVILAATLLPNMLLPIWIAVIVIMIVVTVRLTVSLPASAIGRTEFGLKSAFMATQKNNLPILGLVMATSAIIVASLVVLQIFVSIAHIISPNLNFPVSLLLGIPFQFLVVLLSTAMQTSLYGYFGEGRKF